MIDKKILNKYFDLKIKLDRFRVLHCLGTPLTENQWLELEADALSLKKLIKKIESQTKKEMKKKSVDQ